MVKFVALLERDRSKFGVSFPDAPGCTAMGKSEEEALSNGKDAIGEWIRDLAVGEIAVPQPRTVEELAANEEVRNALSNGSVLVAVN